MNRFRVVVCGLGFVSQFWLPALRARPDVEVVAVAEPDAARAEAAALDCPRFGSLEEALDAVDANLVVNLTAPALHRRVTEIALDGGCDVFGEKPLAATLGDACALVAAAERAGRTFAVMQNRRFAPGMRRLGAGVAGGAIGDPIVLCADMFMAPQHRAGYLEGFDSPLLREMAIHTFDQARFLARAEPVAVTCVEIDRPRSWYSGAAAATATFELADGSVFSYRGSWVSPGLETTYDAAWRISGTRGTAFWDGAGNPVCEAEGVCEVWPVESDASGFAACIDAVLDALADGRRPETDCSDNVRSLGMVFAALRSARERRRVELEELLAQASGVVR